MNNIINNSFLFIMNFNSMNDFLIINFQSVYYSNILIIIFMNFNFDDFFSINNYEFFFLNESFDFLNRDFEQYYNIEDYIF